MTATGLFCALLAAVEPASWNGAEEGAEREGAEIGSELPDRARREANALEAPKPLRGRMLPGALSIDELEVTLRTDDNLDAGRADFELVVRGELHHDFDSPLAELQLGVAVLSQDGLEFVSRRLDASPLHLTQQELQRPFPNPVAALLLSVDAEQVAPGIPTKYGATEAFEDTKVGGSPAYLLVIQGYSFVAPSERDVLSVLDRGGPADLAALAAWASATANDGVDPFDAEGRRRILDRVIERIGTLRAPPAWGDFQRINALAALAHACADRADLERILGAGRAMGVLLASTVVSHDGAAAEENALGLSIHGFARVAARSEAAVSWEAATRRIRIRAFDRLLRLAFDPLDFRQAPAATVRYPRLRQQARELLAPISPTAVPQVLDATEGRVDVQREALRFYIEVRHAPVVDPLTTWLVAHPQEVVDVGLEAMRALGTAMLPVLLRRHGDMDATSAERDIVWRLLSALPEAHAAELAEALRSLGVEVVGEQGAPPTIEASLAAMREHDAQAVLDRLDELAQRISDTSANDRAALRGRMRAAEQLVDLSAERAVEHADAIIALYVTAAREFDLDNPGERNTVTARLVEFPLGPRQEDAARAATLVNVELLLERRRIAAAQEALLADDPELAAAPVRERYTEIVLSEFRHGRNDRDWTRAHAALDRIEEHVPEALDVAAARQELGRLRLRPWLIAGLLVASAGVAFAGAFARKRRTPAGEDAPPVDGEHEEPKLEAAPATSRQGAAASIPATSRAGVVAPTSPVAPTSLAGAETRVLDMDPFDDFPPPGESLGRDAGSYGNASNQPASSVGSSDSPFDDFVGVGSSARIAADPPAASDRSGTADAHAAGSNATAADAKAADPEPGDGGRPSLSPPGGGSPFDDFAA